MAVAVDLPVFMRLGVSGHEHQIGSIELPVDGNGWLTFDRARLAAALRDLADEVENPSTGKGVDDAAPR